MARYSLRELLYWRTFQATIVGVAVICFDAVVPQVVFCVLFLVAIVAQNRWGVLSCVVLTACFGALSLITLLLIVHQQLAIVSNPPARVWAPSTTVIVGGALGSLGGVVVAGVVVLAGRACDRWITRQQVQYG